MERKDITEKAAIMDESTTAEKPIAAVESANAEKNIIPKRINEIRKEISFLNGDLKLLESMDIQYEAIYYECISIGAARRSEKITCNLRNLAYSIPSVKKENYLLSAASRGISIMVNAGRKTLTD